MAQHSADKEVIRAPNPRFDGKRKEISKQVVARVRDPASTLRIPTNIRGGGRIIIGSRRCSPKHHFQSLRCFPL
jgi:hypothetical protein